MAIPIHDVILLSAVDYPIIVLTGTCLVKRNLHLEEDGTIQVQDGGELLII